MLHNISGKLYVPSVGDSNKIRKNYCSDVIELRTSLRCLSKYSNENACTFRKLIRCKVKVVLVKEHNLPTIASIMYRIRKPGVQFAFIAIFIES